MQILNIIIAILNIIVAGATPIIAYFSARKSVKQSAKNNFNDNYINTITINRKKDLKEFLKNYSDIMSLYNQYLQTKNINDSNEILKKVEIYKYKLQLSIDTDLLEVDIQNGDKHSNYYYFLMSLIEHHFINKEYCDKNSEDLYLQRYIFIYNFFENAMITEELKNNDKNIDKNDIYLKAVSEYKETFPDDKFDK